MPDSGGALVGVPEPWLCGLCGRVTWCAALVVRCVAICAPCLEDIEAEIARLQLLDPARRVRLAGGPRLTPGVLLQTSPGWTAP